jgi:hypothetical protein
VSPEKTTLQSLGENNDNARPTPKKAYRSPCFSVYGRIERNTGGGSGMAKESLAMETFRFP